MTRAVKGCERACRRYDPNPSVASLIGIKAIAVGCVILGFMAGCSSKNPDPLEQENSIQVEAEGTPDPKGDPSEAAVKPYYTLQVASFRKERPAMQLSDQLSQDGNEAFIVKRPRKSGENWYMVFVGKFENQSEARQLRHAMKAQFPDSFVRKR